MDLQDNASIQLKAKEFEKDVQIGLPEAMVLTAGRPLEMDFRFNNPQSRKAFSFHLVGYGVGTVEVSDFTVVTKARTQRQTPAPPKSSPLN